MAGPFAPASNGGRYARGHPLYWIDCRTCQRAAIGQKRTSLGLFSKKVGALRKKKDDRHDHPLPKTNESCADVHRGLVGEIIEPLGPANERLNNGGAIPINSRFVFTPDGLSSQEQVVQVGQAFPCRHRQ